MPVDTFQRRQGPYGAWWYVIPDGGAWYAVRQRDGRGAKAINLGGLWQEVDAADRQALGAYVPLDDPNVWLDI
jgi:hypothetical protein